MSGLAELIFVNFICIAVLFLIIKATLKQGKKAVFHLIVAALYLITIIWLGAAFFKLPETGGGGEVFAIGMYSMIIPGLLTFLSAIIFIITEAFKKDK